MKTKIFFRTISLSLTLLALLFTAACSYDEHLTNEDSFTIQQGHEFPVTINVGTQLHTTRACYNIETMKLSFNAGDQLLVSGYHESAGQFAGYLLWISGVSFDGIITTEKAFTGTAYNLLEDATSIAATLLPNDYCNYGFLSIGGSGYSSSLNALTMKKAFADTKAHGVEQLSYVHADKYTNGFALSPGNAILSCTITGLTANKEYMFTVTDGIETPSGTVTSDDAGQANFAVAFVPEGARNYSIKIGDGSEFQDINIGAKDMAEGCIYVVRTAALGRI